MSDVSVDIAVTAGSDTQLQHGICSERVVAPDPYDYTEAYPFLFLTPTLLRENSGLLTRGQAYYIGSQLIASDRGNVYIGLMGGVFVSIKDLGKDALQGTARDRTIREIFTLESGRDRGACFPAYWTPSRNLQRRITGPMWYSKYTAYQWTSFGRCTVTAGRTHSRWGTSAKCVCTVAELFTISTILYVLYIQTSRSPTSLSRRCPPAWLVRSHASSADSHSWRRRASLLLSVGVPRGHLIGHPKRPTLTKAVAPNDRYWRSRSPPRETFNYEVGKPGRPTITKPARPDGPH